MMRAASLRRISPLLLPLLLALALLLGPLAPLAPPPASASHEVLTPWSATLTFADITPSGNAGVGCSDADGATTAYACARSDVLSKNSFKFLGVDYTVQTIWFNESALTVTLTFDKNVPEDFDLLTFHNGIEQHSLADATKNGASITVFLDSAPGQGAVGVPTALKLTFTPVHPGDLDPDFGIGGKLTTAFRSADSEIYDIVEHSGGRIVAVGFTHNGANKDFALVRYNADGSLDTAFGTGGRVTTDFGADDEARAVALQSDGKIVVVGLASISGAYDFAAARYNTDGSLDTTFDTDGKLTTNMGATDIAHAVAIHHSDGKIVLAGQAGNSFGVARYTAAGALDATFDTDGKQTTSFTDGLPDRAHAMAIQSDGKIVLAGYATNNNGTTTVTTELPDPTTDDHEDFAVARYTTAGALDTTFDTDGKQTTDIGTVAGISGSVAGTSDKANAMAIQRDGKIVLAGDVSVVGTGVGLARYTTAGALDTNLSTGFGRTLIGTGNQGNSRTGRQLSFHAHDNLSANAVIVSGIGIHVAGRAEVGGRTASGGSDNFLLQRYDTDGSTIDVSSTDQVVTEIAVDSFERGDDVARAIVIATDGQSLVLGGFADIGSNTAWNGFALARFTNPINNDTPMQLVTDFGIGGTVTTPFGQRDARSNAITVLSDGTIMTAGYAQNGADDDFALAAYNPDGSPDTGFADNGRLVHRLGSGSADRANAMALNDISGSLWRGNVVVAGFTSSDGAVANRDFAVVVYETIGSVFSGFGSGSGVATDFGGYADQANAVTWGPEDTVIAAGSANGSGGVPNFALARYAADGVLDTSFSDDGKVTLPFTANGAEAFAVAVQPDGKIVVAGYAGNGSDKDFAVARYTTAGELDTTFGEVVSGAARSGAVTTAIGPADDVAYAMVLDGDKILLAGYACVGSDSATCEDQFALVRYTGSGDLDTTFGAGGKVTTDIGDDDEIRALAVRDDGKIVVAGYATNGSEKEFALARYRSDGALDRGFGAARTGTVTTDCFIGDNAEAYALALQPDDAKIVVAGGVANGNNRDSALARYLGEGTLSSDTSLSGLSVSDSADGATFDRHAPLSPSFPSSAAAYTAVVRDDATHVQVTATTSDARATITLNDQAITSGAASGAIAVTPGTTTLTVVVTAEDGATTETHTLSFATLSVFSTDASLSALTAESSEDGSTFSALTLTPAFDSATADYSATVDHPVRHVRLTPTTTQSIGVTVTVKGAAVASGSASAAIALAVGDNPITVRVTAGNGATGDYTVTIRRLPLDSSLSTLTVNISTDGSDFATALTLTPAFAGATTAYSATVGNPVTHVKLTPTTTQSGEVTVTVNGETVASGSPSAAIAVEVGDNRITVRATATGDGSTSDYTVTINKLPAATLSNLEVLDEYGSLRMQPGQFYGTWPQQTQVVFDAPGIRCVKIKPHWAAGSTVTVNVSTWDMSRNETISDASITADEPSGTESECLRIAPGGGTKLNVSVTEGSATTEYGSKYLTRELDAANADNYLGSIGVSPNPNARPTSWFQGTGAPGYYNMLHREPGPAAGLIRNVSHQSAGPLTSWWQPASGYGRVLPSDPYTPVAGLPQQNSGSITLTPAFDPFVQEYTATVPLEVSSVFVNLSLSHPKATATVNGNSPSTPVSLEMGENVVTVVVTAESGVQRTYTLTITRKHPNRPPAVASAIADATIINESGTRQFSLSDVFSDPDADDLTITANSSGDSVATASVSDDQSTLTVTARGRGTAVIGVNATDGRGGEIWDLFFVKVKAAPVVASAIADVSDLEAEDSRVISLSGVFSDPDGDSLTIKASSSDEAKATVAVAADQSTLTVAGVGEGTATITVTAQDADGNTVNDAFDATVVKGDNAPTVASAVDDATITNESGTSEVSLSGVFTDADGDDLTVTASSSNENVATVSVSADYSTLTVSAQARGVATVTVTAADGYGGSVEDSFSITVKAAPVVAQPLSDVIGLEPEETHEVSMSGAFSDADGDALTITASSSDEAAATVSMSADHSTLTVTGVAEGTGTITVTAQDADGNRVSDSFTVTVSAPANNPPTVSAAIADAIIVNESGTQTVSLTGVFDDADGDDLTVTASSSDESVATVSVASDQSRLTVTAQARGTATITVTAADGNSGTVDDTFTVRVKAAPVVASAIADVSELEVDATHEVSMSGVFSDADGDRVTVTEASSSDSAIAAVSDAIDGSTAAITAVTVIARSEGTAIITVKAQDSDGNTMQDAFDVTVNAPAAQQQRAVELPGPVLDLELAATHDSVSVSWRAPESGDAPDGYIVHIKRQGGGDGETRRPGAGKTSLTFRDLNGGSTYEVWVRAQNEAGKGERTHATITLPSVLPGPVTGLEVAATEDGVTVSWRAPETGGAPDGYIVHLKPEDGGSGRTKTPRAKKTKVSFDNLEAGQTYEVWVRAQNEAGKGERVHASVTLPEADPTPEEGDDQTGQ